MTNKQKAVAKKIVGSGGSMTISQAMREVGYSEKTIDEPKKLTESKGWKELMETLLPDEKLLLRHAEGLDATKIHSSHTEPDREVPDYAVRAKYVELGYKVKGKYADPGGVTNNILVIPGELIKKYDKPAS